MLALIESGVPLISMQVQYSLLDARPAKQMVKAAAEHGVSLLCYGTVAGGFLSDRWLGAPEPAAGFENRSLIKYKLIIDDFGGWALFQRLLQTLRAHRRPPRQRHRHRGQCRDAEAAGCRRRHRRRAQPLASRFQPGHIEPRAQRRRITPRSTRCWRSPTTSKATCSSWSATATAATARS